MTKTQANYVTNKDHEAVKRLRMYFRENPELVWKYGASDDGFMQWMSEVLAVIRREDMKRVKEIMMTGNNGKHVSDVGK